MITVYSKDNCPYCKAAIKWLTDNHFPFQVLKIGEDVTREWVLETFPTMRTVPIIMKGDTLIGGYNDMIKPFMMEANTGIIDERYTAEAKGIPYFWNRQVMEKKMETRQDWADLLRENVVTLKYENKDGEITERDVTLNESYIDYIPSANPNKKERKPDETSVVVWDIGRKMWRRLKLNNIVFVKKIEPVKVDAKPEVVPY